MFTLLHVRVCCVVVWSVIGKGVGYEEFHAGAGRGGGSGGKGDGKGTLPCTHPPTQPAHMGRASDSPEPPYRAMMGV